MLHNLFIKHYFQTEHVIMKQMPMKQLALLLFLCTYTLQAQHFNLSSPPIDLTLFGTGFVSTAINERDFQFLQMVQKYTLPFPLLNLLFKQLFFVKKLKENGQNLVLLLLQEAIAILNRPSVQMVKHFTLLPIVH